MKSLLTAVLILIATLTAHASLTCERLFDPHARPRLTHDQTIALKGLEGGEYRSSVQRITIAGVERLVVVIGERHIKSEDDAARFEKVLKAFEFHGLEGLNLSNYWFPSVMKKILNFKKTAARPKGSSLHELENANARQTFLELFADLLATGIREGTNEKADTFADIDDGTFLNEMAKRVSESPLGRDEIEHAKSVVLSLPPGELKALIESKLSGVALPKVLSSPKVTAFSLEADYKPGVSENLKVLSFAAAPILRSATVCYAAACAVGATAFALTHEARFLETGVIGYMAPFAGSALLHAYGNNFFALDRRNHHMMKTLSAVLEKDPEIDTIVVTVGQLHVSGIVDILKAQGSQTVDVH